MAYLYRHIRLDTNMPFYIGVGSDSDGKYTRAEERTHRNKFWLNVVKKTDYITEIVIDNLLWHEAHKKEVEFIKLYGRYNLGKGTLVNLTDGGQGAVGRKFSVSLETKEKLRKINTGKQCSDETKVKISKALTGIKRSSETLKKCSAAQKGVIKNVGRKASEECKDKIRQSLLGRKRPIEVCENIRNSLIGRKLSQEHIEKCRLASIGKKRSAEACKNISLSLIGRKLSPEHIEKCRINRLGKKASDITKAKRSASMKKTLSFKKLKSLIEKPVVA